MSTQREIKDALGRWIAERPGNEEVDEIADDARLIEEGLLRSIDVLELVPYLEELRGARVGPEELRPGVFVSLDVIYETFFA